MAKTVNQLLDDADAYMAMAKQERSTDVNTTALIHALSALTSAVQAVAIAVMSRP
jgi:hypothetical protein